MQRDLVIGFRNLFGDHTGLAQAKEIAYVLRSYDICHKFYYFVGDNATNNDNELIKGLNEHLGSNLTMDNRIRCAGHMINLVVKAAIYGSGVSKFEADLQKAAPKDQFELFRKHGVVGKLHNFVNGVLRSTKRRELFHSVQLNLALENDELYNYGTLNLRADGGVRWHSVYLMLLRCLELKLPIQRFVRNLRGYDIPVDTSDYSPLTDALSDDEWIEVEQLVDFLRIFYEMTKRLEGNQSGISGFGSLWQTLPNLQTIHRVFEMHEAELKHLPDTSYIRDAVKFGQEKLNKYWGKLM